MGSFILLLTSPVSEVQIVLGKFLAAYAFICLMIAPTAVYAVLMLRCGSPDLGPIATGYLGLVLAAAALTAIGLFASSLTETPVVSAVVATGISIALWMTTQFEEILGASLGKLLSALSLNAPLYDFCYGVVYTKHVILYLSITAFFLFACTRVLRSHRWG